MKIMKTVLAGIVLSMGPLSVAFAQHCSKQSPAHTVALLELYTSEGCDSCPQADRFVSGLHHGQAAGLTADQLVPLSLHVDYWDYIGWKDIFARRAFTERQRRLADLADSRTVYTPEIFVGGRELRNWRNALPAAVNRVNAIPAQADIRIVLGKTGINGLPVEVSAKSAQAGQLYVVLYENGLSSEVKAGENRGVTLKHDYVVRDLIGPIALSGEAKAGNASLSHAFAIPSGAVAKNLGVAAFVQTDKGIVLQALALSVCGG